MNNNLQPIGTKLYELQRLREDLVFYLGVMGVFAGSSEKLSTLIPKVLDIKPEIPKPTSGFFIKEYDSSGNIIDAEIIGMTSIPNYYLYSYSANTHIFKTIKNLKLPSTLTSIGQYAFYYLSGLEDLGGSELSDEITSIGQYAFYGCSKLVLEKLPSKITTIPNNCFWLCKKLALRELPDGITSVGSYGFNQCENMPLEKLPSKLTTISSSAFKQCYMATFTEVPSGVKSLSSAVFFSCRGLTELTFKGAITSVGMQCFDGCTNLSKLVFPNITKLPSLGTNALRGTAIENGEGYVYLKDEFVESAKTATNWSVYAAQIKPISEMPVS